MLYEIEETIYQVVSLDRIEPKFITCNNIWPDPVQRGKARRHGENNMKRYGRLTGPMYDIQSGCHASSNGSLCRHMQTSRRCLSLQVGTDKVALCSSI